MSFKLKRWLLTLCTCLITFAVLQSEAKAEALVLNLNAQDQQDDQLRTRASAPDVAPIFSLIGNCPVLSPVPKHGVTDCQTLFRQQLADPDNALIVLFVFQLNSSYIIRSLELALLNNTMMYLVVDAQAYNNNESETRDAIDHLQSYARSVGAKLTLSLLSGSGRYGRVHSKQLLIVRRSENPVYPDFPIKFILGTGSLNLTANGFHNSYENYEFFSTRSPDVARKFVGTAPALRHRTQAQEIAMLDYLLSTSLTASYGDCGLDFVIRHLAQAANVLDGLITLAEWDCYEPRI